MVSVRNLGMVDQLVLFWGISVNCSHILAEAAVIYRCDQAAMAPSYGWLLAWGLIFSSCGSSYEGAEVSSWHDGQLPSEQVIQKARVEALMPVLTLNQKSHTVTFTNYQSHRANSGSLRIGTIGVQEYQELWIIVGNLGSWLPHKLFFFFHNLLEKFFLFFLNFFKGSKLLFY